MDKSMAKGLVIGGIAAVVLGAGAVTGYRTMATPKSADVVAVKEVIETVVTPQERCDEVAVRHQAPVQDDKRLSGKEGVVRTAFKPGATLPVKDGQVVVAPPDAPAKS